MHSGSPSLRAAECMLQSLQAACRRPPPRSPASSRGARASLQAAGRGAGAPPRWASRMLYGRRRRNWRSGYGRRPLRRRRGVNWRAATRLPRRACAPRDACIQMTVSEQWRQ